MNEHDRVEETILNSGLRTQNKISRYLQEHIKNLTWNQVIYDMHCIGPCTPWDSGYGPIACNSRRDFCSFCQDFLYFCLDLLLQLTTSTCPHKRVWVLCCAVLLIFRAQNGAAQKTKRKNLHIATLSESRVCALVGVFETTRNNLK